MITNEESNKPKSHSFSSRALFQARTLARPSDNVIGGLFFSCLLLLSGRKSDEEDFSISKGCWFSSCGVVVVVVKGGRLGLH